MNFDIVIITYKREELLQNCLKSIFEKKAEGLKRVVLVNNGEKDLHYPNDPSLEYYEIAQCSPAKARNFAVEKCDSDWIVFLDDDVIVPSHYFEEANETLHHQPFLDILGGPDQSYPKGSLMQRALGVALKSPMTTGHTRHRHLINKEKFLTGNESNLILCHLWVKRSLFNEGFTFPENYFRNEENVFLERLKKSGKKMLHKPELFVFHYRKNSIKDLMRSTLLSAYYRKKSLYEHETRFNIFFIIPTLFTFYLVFLIFNFHILTVIPLVLYVFLSLIWLVSQKESFLLKIYILKIQLLIHIAYGVGFMFPSVLIKKITKG